MRIGITFLGGSVRDVADASTRAEAAGLDSVWTTEFLDRSATVSVAAMGTATEQVTVGSAIMYAVGRSPLVLAVEARDLDELSGGRFVLGLGTGTRRMMSGWHGADSSAPAVRVEELVPLLRRLWRLGEGPVVHDGRFYQVQIHPTAEFRAPVRERIPIYLAGVNRRMVRAVGTVGDGLVTHPLVTHRYLDDVIHPALADGATRGGRSVDEITVAGYVICALHEDEGVARREAKAQLAFYSVVRTYAALLEPHGWDTAATEMRAAWERRDVEGMIAAVPDEMLDQLAVATTPDAAAAQLAATPASTCDETLLYPPSFGVKPERFRANVETMTEVFGRLRQQQRAGGAAAGGGYEDDPSGDR